MAVEEYGFLWVDPDRHNITEGEDFVPWVVPDGWIIVGAVTPTDKRGVYIVLSRVVNAGS